MSALTREETLALMAWADGELEGEEAAEAEALLARPEGKAFVEALGVLGDQVRAIEAARELPVEGLTAAVMAKLPEAEAAAAPPKVLPIDRAALRRQGRTRAAVVGGTLLAMAAAALAYVRVNPGGTAAVPSSSETPVVAAAHGVQVDSVEAAENREVSVFYVGDDQEKNPSVVVWIDEPGEQGGAP